MTIRKPTPPADFRSPEAKTLEDLRKLKTYLQAHNEWLDAQLAAGTSPTGAASGDLAGTYPAPTVTQARGLKSATTTVAVSAATAPTSGQVLTATGPSAATWQTPAPGGVTSFNARTGVVVPTSGDYTATLVGLGNVTNDAQLKRSAGDFASFTTKSAPTPSDILLIEDAASSNAKAKITLGQLPSSGAFLGAQGLNVPPLTAGTIDDEFDSTSLNAAWIFRDFTAGVTRTPTATTPLTPYTDITGAASVPKYALHTNGRRSHLLVQTTVTGAPAYGILRPYTWSAGKFLWGRCGTVVTSAINVCGIILLADTAGTPDTANYVLIAYGGGGGTGLFSRIRIAGVNTDVTQNLTAGTQTWPYLGIENSAATLGAAARWWTYGFNDDGGQTILSAGVAHAFTPAWVGFDFGNVHGTPTIFSADFLRESTGHPLYAKT